MKRINLMIIICFAITIIALALPWAWPLYQKWFCLAAMVSYAVGTLAMGFSNLKKGQWFMGIIWLVLGCAAACLGVAQAFINTLVFHYKPVIFIIAVLLTFSMGWEEDEKKVALEEEDEETEEAQEPTEEIDVDSVVDEILEETKE